VGLGQISLSRAGQTNKGIVIRHLMKISCYSRQQITVSVSGFTRKYTPKDIRLLAAMDESACEVFWQTE
jgi:hypothetical protein